MMFRVHVRPVIDQKSDGFIISLESSMPERRQTGFVLCIHASASRQEIFQPDPALAFFCRLDELFVHHVFRGRQLFSLNDGGGPGRRIGTDRRLALVIYESASALRNSMSCAESCCAGRLLLVTLL
jgi:hypothetical protein